MTPALVCAGILCGLIAGKALGNPAVLPVAEGTAPYRQGFANRLR